MASHRKSRARLDQLTEDQQQAIFEFGESHVLESTVEWLRAEFDVEISGGRLGKWLEGKRRDHNFSSLLADLRHDRNKAMAVGKAVGDTTDLTAANVGLLNQALFTALQSEDPKEQDRAATLLSLVITAQAKDRKSRADSMAVTIARDRFEVQTCELFIKWMKDAKAREIAESSLSNADKIKRLRQEYFADIDELEKSGKVVLPE